MATHVRGTRPNSRGTFNGETSRVVGFLDRNVVGRMRDMWWDMKGERYMYILAIMRVGHPQ